MGAKTSKQEQEIELSATLVQALPTRLKFVYTFDCKIPSPTELSSEYSIAPCRVFETCQKDAVVNSSILVNFVTLRSALQKFELNYNSWPQFVSRLFKLNLIHLESLSALTVKPAACEPVLTSVAHLKFVFIVRVNWANIEQDTAIQKLKNLVTNVWIAGPIHFFENFEVFEWLYLVQY